MLNLPCQFHSVSDTKCFKNEVILENFILLPKNICVRH